MIAKAKQRECKEVRDINLLKNNESNVFDEENTSSR